VGAFKIKGNAGFLIYIADAFGYFGSVLALLYKNFGQSSLTWLAFFVKGAYLVAGIGVLVTSISILYLSKKHKKNKKQNINYQFVLNENTL
jgi:hypothetical protein